MGHPLIDDDRFDPFEWGATYAAEPMRIVTDQLQMVRFHLATHGNFRPLGRVLERAQDTAVFVLSDGLSLPVDVVLRGWFALSMAALAVVFVAAVATLTTSGSVHASVPNRAVVLAPLVLPALLIASGRQAPVVNFTDIYLQTLGLVLLVAMLAARSSSFARGPVRAVELSVAAFLGLVVAAFSELGTLAAPMAVLFVTVRGLVVLRLPLADWVRTPAVKLTTAGVLGFAGLFLPIRAWLISFCQTSFCHAPSLVRISEDVPFLFLQRAGSWVPAAGWRVATAETAGRWWWPSDAVTVALILVLVGIGVAIARDLARAAEVPPTARWSLLITGIVTITLGALLGAVSVYVQTRPFTLGTGWRDTAVTLVGGGLLLSGLAAWLTSDRRAWSAWLSTSIAVLLLVTTTITLNANGAWTDRAREDPQGLLFSRISSEIARFDPSANGERRRCEILDAILINEEPGSYTDRRLIPALNAATRHSHQQPFCSDTL